MADGEADQRTKSGSVASSWRSCFLALVVCSACLLLNAGLLSSIAKAVPVLSRPPVSRAAASPVSFPLQNIVMIETTYQSFRQELPWQTVQATFQDGLQFADVATGSGLVLENGLILTAAYIATDSAVITVRRPSNGTKYRARVVALAPDLDLALLTVDGEKSAGSSFWHHKDVEVKLETGKLPRLGAPVLVAGFEASQEASLSRVHARISRVVVDSETSTGGALSKTTVIMSGRYAPLAVPSLSLYPDVGSSVTVGPVFAAEDGNLVGFLARDGKVVPAKIVSNFVKATHANDSRWLGLARLGLVLRPMENVALRMFWGLPPDDKVGLQVRSIAPDSPLISHVQRNDVIMAVDGQTLQSSRQVIYRGVEGEEIMVPFEALLGEKAPGEKSKFTIFRPKPSDVENSTVGFIQDKQFDVEVSLTPLQPLISSSHYPGGSSGGGGEKQPSYFVVGGLVWVPFSEDLLIETTFSDGLVIPTTTQIEALHRWRQNPEEQVVVLLRALEHDCNKFYASRSFVRVLKLFNDKPITNLTHLVRQVGEALQSKERFLSFVFLPLTLNDDAAGGSGDPDLVLDTRLCAGADKELMQAFGLTHPASPDIQNLYDEVIPSTFSSPAADRQRSTDEKRELAAAAPFRHEDHVVPTIESASDESSEESELPWTNVVQITLFSIQTDHLKPWVKQFDSQSRCSGIIVDVAERRILTNSHCVAGAQSIELMREDLRQGSPAKIIEIARDVDLAWVTTDDDRFWASKDLRPKVAMSDSLPHLSSSVRVIGYPMGGNDITITQGIISRIDGQTYPNGLDPADRNTPANLLIIQIDAAINHGNSGGPVFNSKGELVGLAFSGLMSATNTGYVIPNVYLKNFMNAVTSAPERRWVAQPEIGALFRRIENAGIREYLGLRKDESGIQLRTVSPMSPLFGAANKGDVLIAVDGHQVSGAATVVREFHGRAVMLPFDTLVSEKAVGAETTMTFMRPSGHKIFNVTKAFKPLPPLAARFDDSPVPVAGREGFAVAGSYFIVWGLIFGVFSTPMLQQAEASKSITIPWSVSETALQKWRKDTDEQTVVLMGGLQYLCNMYYDLGTMRVLQHFNGEPVKNLKELVQMAVSAEYGPSDFMRFSFAPLADKDTAATPTDPDIVLHRHLCAKGVQGMLQSHGIPSPVSNDLAETYQTTLAGAQKDLLSKLTATGQIVVENHVGNASEQPHGGNAPTRHLPHAVVATPGKSLPIVVPPERDPPGDGQQKENNTGPPSAQSEDNQ